MKKVISILCLMLFVFVNAKSNEYVHQIFVLNEGYFDYSTNQIVEPVTIGVYTPSDDSYSVVDTIENARFASDLVVHEDFFYVAADNKLLKYDINNYNLVASQNIDGIRNIKIHNEKVFVSRGDYDNTTFMPIQFASYLQVYSLSDLSFSFEFDTVTGPKWSTQNMIVNEDKLYVAINNAYEWGNEKGIIGVVDLSTNSYETEIDLGPDGKNPDNLMKFGSNLYTVNNKNWSGSSISKVNFNSYYSTTTNLAAAPTGCGTSVIRDAKINYQISGDTVLYEWDIFTLSNNGNSLPLNNNFYELAYDHVNDWLYTTSTDYFSYGIVEVYDNNNNIVNSFNCGISPGTIAIDFRVITDLFEVHNEKSNINNIYDLSGKVIDLENLKSGVFIKNNKATFIVK